MKKIVIGALVIMALVAAGMPVINGILMEKGIKKLAEDYNTRYAEKGTQVKIEILQYDRGLLSSEIQWKVDMSRMKAFYGVEEILLVERVKHGYTSVVSTTSLEQNQWFSDFVNTKLGGKNPLAITTEYALNGQIRTMMSLEPFALQVEGRDLQSEAAELVFVCDWELEHFDTSGTWQGISAQEEFSLGGLSLDSQLTMISPYIWDGYAAVKVDTVNVKEEGLAVELKGLTAKNSMSFDKTANRLAMELTYGVDAISDGTEKFENGSATIAIKGIDAAAYEEAMDVYVEMVNSLVDDINAAGDDPERMMAAMQARMGNLGIQMLPLAEKFLKNGLEIALSNVHAKLPQGEIDGEVQLRLLQDMNLSQMMPMMNQPELIFNFIALKTDVRLPAVLVGDNPMLLEPAYPGMKTGLFVKDGDNLVHKAETRDKKLFINGEELPLN